jgi:hypothetical protein
MTRCANLSQRNPRGPSRRVVLVGGGLLVAACVPATFRSKIERLTPGATIVLMPLDVELYELSAGGMLEPKADWTEAARRNLDAALEAEKRQRGLRFDRFDDSRLSVSTRAELDQIQRLHGAVGHAVMRHAYLPNDRLPAKGDRFDWSLGPGVATLRAATGADHALFVRIRDSYTSAGRAAVQMLTFVLFRVGVSGGVQAGFASVVDLRNGDIVWFNRIERQEGDLRTAQAAAETARTLLAGFPS